MNKGNGTRVFLLVGGMPRSGTTLIETVLGSHSDIAIPPGDFPFAEQHAKGLGVERIFSILSKKSTWEKWEVKDFSHLTDRDHAYAFRQSMVDYASGLNKCIPGAKAPFTEFFYEKYRDWLPDFDVKFVHIVRNPFDVLASLKKSHIHTNWHVFRDIIEVQARNWQRSASLGLSRRFAEPANYFLIRYEDFVSDPAASIGEMCLFLGVEVEDDRMLNRADYTYHSTNTSFPDDKSGNDTDSAYIYRSKSRKSYLDSSEVELISQICGEAARSLGYEDPDFHCNPPEYANKVIFSVRVRRKLARIFRRLFG